MKYIYEIDSTFTEVVRKTDEPFSNYETILKVYPNQFDNSFSRIRFLEKAKELCELYMKDPGEVKI